MKIITSIIYTHNLIWIEKQIGQQRAFISLTRITIQSQSTCLWSYLYHTQNFAARSDRVCARLTLSTISRASKNNHKE